jgi:hypothetical protein
MVNLQKGLVSVSKREYFDFVVKEDFDHHDIKLMEGFNISAAFYLKDNQVKAKALYSRFLNRPGIKTVASYYIDRGN